MKTWTIDPIHSEIAFKVKHLMISTIRGTFNKFEGKISSKDDTFNDGLIEFNVDINSLDTRHPDRDGHLLSVDFFEVETFPKLSFISTLVKRNEETLDIIGNLTIKNITKPVELKAKINGTNKGMKSEKVTGFELSGKLNRQDFGLTWNVNLETGGILIGNEINIEAFVEILEA